MARQIRLATAGDAHGIDEIYRPVVVETAISFETDPPSETELRHRIKRTIERHPWIVCEQDGAVLGYALANAHASRSSYQWTVNVSAYVKKSFRGKGIGSALYRTLFEIVRHQGFVTACAVIALPNPESVGFHESHGFEPIGVFERAGYKNGAWRDVGWWQRLIREPPADSEPPTPLPEIVDSPEWNVALETGEAALD